MWKSSKGARSGVNTVNTPYEYQVELELGDYDTTVFAGDAANTNAGKMKRLQVLGLFKRPINYATAPQCLAMVWPYFKAEIYPSGTDPAAEMVLAQAVNDFVVEGGALPTAGTFKKIRVPGDYPVFYRKGDAEELTEPEYTLGGGVGGAAMDRYKVEQRFWNANPTLGQIPLVATVKRRAKGSKGIYTAAPANIKVYFQLVKPDKLPAYAPYGGSAQGAGATSYVTSVVAPPLRATVTERSPLQSPKNPSKGKPGPAGYLGRHVGVYPQEVRSSDPQQGNAHWHLGGKFQMGANVKDLSSTQTAGPNTRRNIFAGSPTSNAMNALDLTNKKERALHNYSVWVNTDGAGKAGVLFQPSRIGGDRYKLRAYVYENSKYYEIETGTMVVWRTIRISRDIVTDAATAIPDLAADLTTGLSPFYGQCVHSMENQYCGNCLVREGAVPPVKFREYFTKELAKAYCELLLEPKAVTPVASTSVAIQNDITNFMLPAIQNNPAVNRLRLNEGQLLAIGDGVTTAFNNLQIWMTNLEPGNVKLKLGVSEAIDDGAGNFPATPALNLLSGTVNYATGVVDLVFAPALPRDGRVSAVYTGLRQIDFASLLYFPPLSPWLFNLRTPEDYNTQVHGTAFAPIPVQVETEQTIGVADGVVDILHGNMFPVGQGAYNPVEIRLLLGGTEIGKDQNLAMYFAKTGAVQFFSRVNYLTGDVSVACRKDEKDDVGIGDGVQTLFNHVLAHPPLEAMAGTADVTMLVKVAGATVGTLLAHGVLKFTSGPMAGGTVTVTVATQSVAIQFGVAPALNAPIEVTYSSKIPFPANGNLTVKSKVGLPNVRTTVGLTSRVIPGAGYVGAITEMVNDSLLIAFGRAVANNQGYMPGLICVRAPSRDTWTSLYKNLTVEGKGICNIFLMFLGTMAAATGRNPYETIALHECGHSLYFQHYDSGSAAGPRSDLHDMWDNCMMGYARSEGDICGQCVANYMGLNVHDIRFRTWEAAVTGAVFNMPDKTHLFGVVTG